MSTRRRAQIVPALAMAALSFSAAHGHAGIPADHCQAIRAAVVNLSETNYRLQQAEHERQRVALAHYIATRQKPDSAAFAGHVAAAQHFDSDVVAAGIAALNEACQR